MNPDVWQTLTIIISFIALILGFLAIRNRPSYSGNPGDGITVLLTKIDVLEKKVADRDARIAELRRDIDIIKSERDASLAAQRQTIAALQERITFLESLLFKVTKNIDDVPSSNNAEQYIAPGVLLITSDDKIQRSDEIALNRARIPYRRVTKATLEKIDDEFRRRRAENKMYKYIIFSAHMNENGIELADKTVLDSYWLSMNITNDVKVVILNGCRSTKIADDLSGTVDYVISMSEDINNNDATTFLTTLWRRFKQGDTFLTAYTAAKQSAPGAAPFIDIQYNKTGPLTLTE